MPVQRSNQLSYEATDVRKWSFVGSNVPVKNKSTMTYHFIVDSFLTGTLEPRNDQLPKLEISTNFELKLIMNNKSGFPPPPLPSTALTNWLRTDKQKDVTGVAFYSAKRRGRLDTNVCSTVS